MHASALGFLLSALVGYASPTCTFIVESRLHTRLMVVGTYRFDLIAETPSASSIPSLCVPQNVALSDPVVGYSIGGLQSTI